MHKHKTAGKAARPCKTSRAQTPTLNETAAELAQLHEQKNRMENRAREKALGAALQFYRCDSDVLRKMVFGNWLQKHIFNHKFEPLEMIGR